MKTSTRLYMARHGRVHADWRGRVYGDLDVPLAPEGEEQSLRVAELFRGRKPDAVLSSGLSRADHTALAIARTSGAGEERVVRDGRLRELHRGRWAGLDRAGVEALEPGGWARWEEAEGVLAPPGGETLEHLHERVTRALDEQCALHAGGVLAVVAHKWVLRVALAEALGLPAARLARLAVPTSGLVALDWPAGGPGGSRGGGSGEDRPVGGPDGWGSRTGLVRVVGIGLSHLA